jgi:osomolarity two-component system sensor histidine kinase SLN1
MGTATAPSSSSAIGAEESTNGDGSFYFGRRKNMSVQQAEKMAEDEQGEVDEVVVDREWSHEVKTSIVDPSEMPQDSHYPGTVGDCESLAVESAFWGSWTPLIVLRYRLWPAIYEFFSTRFYDAKSEGHYAKEAWFMKKVCKLLIQWSLSC